MDKYTIAWCATRSQFRTVFVALHMKRLGKFLAYHLLYKRGA